MKQLICVLFLSPIFCFSQTVEEMVESIIQETDSLMKSAEEMEVGLNQTKKYYQEEISSLTSKYEKASNTKLSLEKSLDSVTNELVTLNSDFSKRYGDKNTIKRFLKENRIPGKDRVNDLTKLDRNTQVNAYRTLKKLQIFNHKWESSSEFVRATQYCLYDYYKSNFINKAIGIHSGKDIEKLNRIFLDSKSKTWPYYEELFVIENSHQNVLLPRGQSILVELPLGSENNITINLYSSNHGESWKSNKLYEKLTKLSTYAISENDKEDLIYYYTGIDQNYFLLLAEIEKFKAEIKDYESKLNNAIQIFNDREKRVNYKVNESKRIINSILEDLDNLTNIINSKDDRISQVYKNDSLRTDYILKSDIAIKQKDYKEAINLLEMANRIMIDDNSQGKLARANKLYAPILAKKQEQERVANEKMKKQMPQAAFQHLKQYLKSPYSAKMARSAVNKIDYCRTIVTLEVDSQNGFGAYLRGSYNVFFANGKPCYAKEGDLTAVNAHLNSSTYRDLQESQLSAEGCGCN